MGALAEFTRGKLSKTDILKTALFFKYLDKPFNHAFNKNNQAIALKLHQQLLKPLPKGCYPMQKEERNKPDHSKTDMRRNRIPLRIIHSA